MLWGLVVLGLVAGSLAIHNDCCSSEDRREMQRMWNSLWSAEYSGRRVAIAQAVFKDLLEHYPGAKELLHGVNVDHPDSPEFKAHSLQIINKVDIAINLLDDPLTLDEQLKHLNHQFQDVESVKAAHLAGIGESFNRVMPHIAPCFNPDAWTHCFDHIINGISEGLP